MKKHIILFSHVMKRQVRRYKTDISILQCLWDPDTFFFCPLNHPGVYACHLVVRAWLIHPLPPVRVLHGKKGAGKSVGTG